MHDLSGNFLSEKLKISNCVKARIWWSNNQVMTRVTAASSRFLLSHTCNYSVTQSVCHSVSLQLPPPWFLLPISSSACSAFVSMVHQPSISLTTRFVCVFCWTDLHQREPRWLCGWSSPNPPCHSGCWPWAGRSHGWLSCALCHPLFKTQEKDTLVVKILRKNKTHWGNSLVILYC